MPANRPADTSPKRASDHEPSATIGAAAATPGTPPAARAAKGTRAACRAMRRPRAAAVRPIIHSAMMSVAIRSKGPKRETPSARDAKLYASTYRRTTSGPKAIRAFSMRWTIDHDTASAPPTRYPAAWPPVRRTQDSSSRPSIAMPTIGPRMTALGEIDFMRAQTTADRQIRPRSGCARCPAVITSTPNAASRLPANGIRRLCRKLPTTISDAAQRLP